MRFVCPRRVVSSLVVLIAVSAPGAWAQSAETDPRAGRFEFIPFWALGDDLAPGAGLGFTISLTRRLALEAEASAGTDAVRTNLSAVFDLLRDRRVMPYVAAGIGVQRDEYHGTPLYGPGLQPPPRSEPGWQPKVTEFTVSIGGGITVPLARGWAYRADFRWYDPRAEWPESWRTYSGLGYKFGR